MSTYKNTTLEDPAYIERKKIYKKIVLRYYLKKLLMATLTTAAICSLLMFIHYSVRFVCIIIVVVLWLIQCVWILFFMDMCLKDYCR